MASVLQLAISYEEARRDIVKNFPTWKLSTELPIVVEFEPRQWHVVRFKNYPVLFQQKEPGSDIYVARPLMNTNRVVHWDTAGDDSAVAAVALKTGEMLLLAKGYYVGEFSTYHAFSEN
ncbi:hypothetical protein EniLVp02_0014 [Vibrio phage EniLVp02]